MRCSLRECRHNFEGFCLIDRCDIFDSNGACFEYDHPDHEVGNVEMFERRMNNDLQRET